MTARALLDAAAACREETVVATVVDVAGSSYRRPGARMLVTRERRLAGAISGGCLEGDIVRRGFWRTEHGPAVVTFDASEDGTGSGCNGVIDVLLERAPGAPIGGIDPLAVLARCVRDQTRATVVTRFRGGFARMELVDGRLTPLAGSMAAATPPETLRGIEQLAREATRTCVVREGDAAYLVEVLAPPPRLFVLGGGLDAVPVIAQARAVGWEVFACVPYARPELRTRLAGADRIVVAQPDEIAVLVDASDRAAVVVMNHDLAHDTRCLGAMLGSRACYLGVLGPRARTNRMLAALAREPDARLHAPVGLQIGAECAEEIALAIVAEVQAALYASSSRTSSAMVCCARSSSSPRSVTPPTTA
ncbi:MAG TPA: XdhC family protein [Kofleriaceae bacterium]|nr:XdhC family protein [Kofleriaceae bacterium]